MTKREELARALAESTGLDWGSLPEGPKWNYSFHRGTFYDGVDALLAALMQPSEEMRKAGFNAGPGHYSEMSLNVDEDEIVEMYQAMLKAIKDE